MKSKKQIFLLYGCNECKDSGSMRLIFATTSKTKIKSMIAKQIKNDYMSYYYDELSTNKQLKLFKEDWENGTRADINNKLIYGYYDYTNDGEEI